MGLLEGHVCGETSTQLPLGDTTFMGEGLLRTYGPGEHGDIWFYGAQELVRDAAREKRR